MNNPSIRLLIYESYAFEKVSGELRTVLYLLKYLDRSCFEPLVVLPFMVDAMRAEANRGTRIEVVEPPAALRAYGGALLKRGLLSRFRAALDLLRYTGDVKRTIDACRIDVIYCCSLRAMLLIGLAARLTRRPVLFFVNGRLNNPILDALAFVMASRIVFQCAANRDDRYPFLRRLFRRKLAVVPSGVDLPVVRRLQAAAPSAESLGVDIRNVNFIVLGLLNPEKGVHLLIEAFARHSARLQAVRLWIVGDQLTDDFSDYRRRLETLVHERGLAGVVHFTGWRTDALELLTAMDVLVHPSLSEGMPRAVLEAMALGKAVIASGVGCSREVIRHGENGLLVSPGNVEELAAALGRVLDDESLRRSMGMAAAATIANEYGIEDKLRALEQLLADMTGIRASGKKSGG